MRTGNSNNYIKITCAAGSLTQYVNFRITRWSEANACLIKVLRCKIQGPCYSYGHIVCTLNVTLGVPPDRPIVSLPNPPSGSSGLSRDSVNQLYLMVMAPQPLPAERPSKAAMYTWLDLRHGLSFIPLDNSLTIKFMVSLAPALVFTWSFQGQVMRAVLVDLLCVILITKEVCYRIYDHALLAEVEARRPTRTIFLCVFYVFCGFS